MRHLVSGWRTIHLARINAINAAKLSQHRGSISRVVTSDYSQFHTTITQSYPQGLEDNFIPVFYIVNLIMYL